MLDLRNQNSQRRHFTSVKDRSGAIETPGDFPLADTLTNSKRIRGAPINKQRYAERIRVM